MYRSFQIIKYFTTDIRIIVGSRIRDSFKEFSKILTILPLILELSCVHESDSFREFSKISTILPLILELSWVHESDSLREFSKISTI